MVDQITCPHCKGSGVNYVIIAKDDKPSIESVNCAVCKGSGIVAIPEEPAGLVNVVQEAELWPILVPLGIFSLFFIFLLI